jgi:hypothetical protein
MGRIYNRCLTSYFMNSFLNSSLESACQSIMLLLYNSNIFHRNLTAPRIQIALVAYFIIIPGR